jgi:hypothetical protein
MKKLLGLALGFALVAWTITPVLATNITCGQSCTAQVTIGTQVFTVPVTVGSNGIGTVSEFTATGAGGSTASINSLTLNPDPFIIFAVAGTNNTDNPLAFAFAFNEPINLTDAIIHAQSSIGYTLTDGFIASQGTSGAAGVTIAPFSPPNILVANDFTPALAATNKGVDVGPLASGGAGTCGAFVGATSNCGPFAATHDFGGGPFTLMAATVSFVLTPHDAAGLSGSVSQIPAPEPTTLLLMASGLLGLAGWRRYSSRR